MNTPQVSTTDFIYTINVNQTASSDNEFLIEIYPFTTDMECAGEPQKVIHNFDELIDFMEKEF